MKAEQQDLDRLRALQKRRDDTAAALGVAAMQIKEEIGYAAQKTRARIEDGKTIAAQLGARVYQAEMAKRQYVAAIQEAERLQGLAGETILRELGFDPDREQYTIDLQSGQVRRLDQGKWVDV